MQSTNKTVKAILLHYKEISLLRKISALLGWDLNVYLPQKAAQGRSEQLAYLTEKITKLWKDKTFVENIEKLKKDKTLTDEEKAMLRNLTHAFKYYTKIPENLLIEREKITSQAYMVWQKAKQENVYKDFAPYLQQIITLNIQMAKHLEYKDNVYDPMLDLHEQDLTAKICQKYFAEIKPPLIKLIKRIQKSKTLLTKNPLISDKTMYSTADQKKLALFILQKMGYDFLRGRMDVSAHPFTISLDDTNDVRITTMYKENDFRDCFTSVMHEAGHALYEQRINPAYADTPLQDGVSFGIHEAMSRFYENQIGRNPAFLTYMTPLLQTFFPEQLKTVNATTIIQGFNHVQPGFIRIESDEVTYTMHIIMRFEIEDDLVNERITVKDAPKIWNQKMKEYFGIIPETDSEGILQDMHWAGGSFGYFPSYALGNLYASQLFARMQKDIAVEEELQKGNLLPITNWLQKHIYQYGSRYWPMELIKKTTGKPLDAKYFIDYLEEKYAKIYHL